MFSEFIISEILRVTITFIFLKILEMIRALSLNERKKKVHDKISENCATLRKYFVKRSYLLFRKCRWKQIELLLLYLEWLILSLQLMQLNAMLIILFSEHLEGKLFKSTIWVAVCICFYRQVSYSSSLFNICDDIVTIGYMVFLKFDFAITLRREALWFNKGI